MLPYGNQRSQPLPEARQVISHGVAHGSGESSCCLLAVSDVTHRAALEELTMTAPGSGYTAVARLSRHLAAMRRAVYTPVRKRPGSPRQLIDRCCAQGRQAEWTLRLLECWLSGASFAMAMPAASLYAQLERNVGGYMEVEQALVAWIEEKLSADDRERLAAGYLGCLSHAPTRPHPRGPRTGAGYRLSFAFHSSWDRLMDGIDSRPGVAHGILERPASQTASQTRTEIKAAGTVGTLSS